MDRLTRKGVIADCISRIKRDEITYIQAKFIITKREISLGSTKNVVKESLARFRIKLRKSGMRDIITDSHGRGRVNIKHQTPVIVHPIDDLVTVTPEGSEDKASNIVYVLSNIVNGTSLINTVEPVEECYLEEHNVEEYDIEEHIADLVIGNKDKYYVDSYINYVDGIEYTTLDYALDPKSELE